MTAHNIIRTMVNRGNTLLGIGCYSAALASRVSEEKAIKIGTDLEDPWLDYYNFIIKKFPNNDFTPKVYSFHWDSDSNYYVCTMERLSAAPSGDVETAKNNAWAIKQFLRHEICLDELWYTTDYDDLEFAQLKEVLLKVKNMTDVVYGDDQNEYDEDARRLDLHDGNIMWRHDLPIIIDPWCHNEMEGVQDLSMWADDHLKDSPLHY